MAGPYLRRGGTVNDTLNRRMMTVLKNLNSLALAALAALFVLILPATRLLAQGRETSTVTSATAVLREIQLMPGRNIPRSLLAKARAVVIIPNMIKIGFIAAGRHGNGVAVIRNANGTWGNPIFVSLTGGGLGFQAGVQSTDVILVFKSQESVSGLLSGKFTIGADAAAAAGPVGRQASAATDIQLKSEILSYSRSRGLFAGVSLDGSVLGVDGNANAVFYNVVGGTPQAIIAGQGIPVPPAAVELKATLTAQSGAPTTTVAPPVQMTAQSQPVPAVGPPFAAAPPAVATRPPAPAPAVTSDQIRRQLATASQQLGAKLDENWRNYLALPATVFAAQEERPSPEAVKLSLDHFNAVASDSKFSALSAMPEFQTTLRHLQQYSATVTSPPTGTPTLPPPPGGGATR